MPWATPEDVHRLTRKTVDADDVEVATGTLQLRTGVVDEQFASLGARDRYWLKMAAAYQAAWIVDRPDLFDRDDVTSAAQDGQSASYQAWALTLAPLAHLALKRLSWRGTRSTSTNPGKVATDDEVDGLGRPLVWTPIR